MCNFLNFFVILILCFAKSRNHNLVLASSAFEENNRNEVLAQIALFEKLNWMITQIKNINHQLADVKRRQFNQEQIRRLSMRDFTSEIREINEQQKIGIETLIGNMTQEVLSNFDRQADVCKKASLFGDDLKSLDITSYKRNRNWQTILRRQDDFVNFNRSWLEYKKGFGNINGDFFIGLESLHAITTYSDPQELLIVLQDFDNKTSYAKYADFVIGSESENYKIKKIGSYEGDAGDSLTQHLNCEFSTFDQDNDNTTMTHCAERYEGGWWFSGCFSSFLTGPYLYQPNIEKEREKGLIWYTWHGLKYSLKNAEMMIRPKL